MPTLQSVIAEKRAQIKKLQTQLEMLEELAAESGASRSPGQPRRTGTARPKRSSKRRPRGANQEKVLGVLTAAPKRLTDIAAAAGLGLSATNSVLQAAIKKRLVAKGAVRGTYLLKTKARPSGGLKTRGRTGRRAGRPRTEQVARKGRSARSAASTTGAESSQPA